MKIKLFDRAKCIGIAKELKIKSGLTEEEVDKLCNEAINKIGG